jgi:hypothetical protein
MNFLPAVPTFTQQSYGKDYGNYQRYAGFGQQQAYGQDASQPVRAPQGAAAAVPPPAQSMGDLMKLAVGPIVDQAKSAMGQAGNMVDAAGQLAQGNVLGAYNASKGNVPATGSSDYQYHTAIGQ